MGGTENEIKAALVRSMQKWGHRYPNAGCGGMFRHWLWAKDPKPYGSFGNGSAMRVAALCAVSDWLSANPDYGMAVVMSRYDQNTRQCCQNVIDGRYPTAGEPID